MVGQRGFDDRWSDDSPEGVRARQNQLARSVERFASFRRDALPPRERLNFDLYEDLLNTAEEALRFGDDPLPFRFGTPRNLWMPLNQMEGIHVLAPDVLDLQPRVAVSDYETILRRLEALPKAIAETMALMEAGRTKGYTPSRVAVRGVPSQLSELAPSDPVQSALLHPFTEFPARVSEADRDRLLAAARQVYAGRLVPALQELRAYVADRYLPACRETVGASHLPDGSEAYRFHLRWQTTTDQTPEQVHETGLAEVRRIQAAMEALMHRVGFSGDLPAFLEFLRTDRRFFREKPEELIEAYRALTKRCDPELARLFGRLPRLPYGVLPLPPFRAPNSPAAYYMPGVPANGRAGYFYVNTHQIGTRASWEMEALALHESVPGHHLQIALAQELGDLPEFRRYSGYTSFIEGWGLYSESLGEELGLYRDLYAKFGQLSFDMWRSVRLVVDTGMHALGWSRERAVAFFRDHTSSSDQDIGVEVDRYIAWPGQACAYKIGQLRLLELRRLAEERLGERFDVRRFHDVVLEEGALPLGILAARVRHWVESEAAANPAR